MTQGQTQSTISSLPISIIRLSPKTCPPMLRVFVTRSYQIRMDPANEQQVMVYRWKRDMGYIFFRMLLRFSIWNRYPTKPPVWHQGAVTYLTSAAVFQAILRSAFPDDEEHIWEDLAHAFYDFCINIYSVQESPSARSAFMFNQLESLLNDLPTPMEGTSHESGSPSAFLSLLRERAGSIEDRPAGSTDVNLRPSPLMPRTRVTSLFDSISFQRTWLSEDEYAHILELGSDGHRLISRMAALKLMDERRPDQKFLTICAKTLELEGSSIALLRAAGFPPESTPEEPGLSTEHFRTILGIMYTLNGDLNGWVPLLRESGTMIQDFHNLLMTSMANTENPVLVASKSAPSNAKTVTESTQAPTTSTAASESKQEPQGFKDATLSLTSGSSSGSAIPIKTAFVPEVPAGKGKGKKKAHVIPASGPSYEPHSEEVKRIIGDAITSAQNPGPSARSTAAPATVPTSSSSTRPSPELWASLTYTPSSLNDSSVLNPASSKASLASVDRRSTHASRSNNQQEITGRNFQNPSRVSSSSIIEGAKQVMANVFSAPGRKRKATSSPQISSEPQMSTMVPSVPQTSHRQVSEGPPPFASKLFNTMNRFNRNGQPSNQDHYYKQTFNNNNRKP